MKKKVLAALIAVVVGHMGVLWAVNHMKAPELKPIEKESSCCFDRGCRGPYGRIVGSEPHESS
jgi:hypothetical protein